VSDKTYRIRKWQDTFETADSRRFKTLSWVSLPVGFTSNGYHELITQFGDRAPEIYGAWCALLSVAAQSPVRGLLASSKGPYSLRRIACETRMPERTFKDLFDWASMPCVGWIEEAVFQPDTNQPDTGRECLKNGLPDQTRPDQTKPSLGAGTGVSAKRTGKEWGKSVFAKLKVEHLRDAEVMADWFLFATTEADRTLFSTSGGYSQANCLFVLAAAERAIEDGDDPLKLFKHLVGKEKRGLITQAQEDRASKRLPLVVNWLDEQRKARP
jgi:hypothetical protein